MLHARRDGETFGLAIAEFAAHNKPVITSSEHHDDHRGRFHLDALGSRGLYYRDKPTLLRLLRTFNRTWARGRDWRAYQAYSPRAVMRRFEFVFLRKRRTAGKGADTGTGAAGGAGGTRPRE